MKVTHRLEKGPVHTNLTLWADGANIGSITVGNDQTEVLSALASAVEARDLLRSMEWGDDNYCPECVRAKEHGHGQGCLLDRALGHEV